MHGTTEYNFDRRVALKSQILKFNFVKNLIFMLVFFLLISDK